ncbi:PTS sugar transporter subunit IIA [uncultured Enterococcus sp.]|uniref:PTS sugar transporter subunit IIA n=1 Tax=uncultured Enterococcus sp. TaxID=167972 RepID=UPI002621F856|nr:PTS sugar transporter subunit IIA [uncultured Enterococcus sp.]
MLQELIDNMYISENLIDLQLQSNSNQEAIKKLANLLLKENFVKESYLEAIIEREKVFSTGLQLKQIGVAIPHTDAIHVKKQGIAIAKLVNPVNFKMMGNPEVDVPVSMMFMLAIKEPHKQLEFLQALINLFQNDDLIVTLSNIKNKKELINEFKKAIDEQSKN